MGCNHMTQTSTLARLSDHKPKYAFNKENSNIQYYHINLYLH